MEIEYALLANAAEMSSDGKLYLMGADISRVYGPTFPLVLPSIAFVVKVTFGPEEYGKLQHLSAGFFAPDGSKIDPQWQQELMPPEPSDPSRQTGFSLVLAATGVTFEKPGTYTARLSINDQERKILKLTAEQLPNMPPGSGKFVIPTLTSGDSNG